MPPIRKISKEDILNITLELLKNEDINNINARRIAKELNISVQPIFYNFKNMEELKSEAIKKIYEIYISYMKKGSEEEKSYLGMGLAYIKFAKENQAYFKLIFMNKTDLTPESFIANDDINNNIINAGIKLTGFSIEEQRKFHLKVWIFTHGLATLVATKTINITDEEISKLLEHTVREMLIGIRKEEGNE